MGKSVLGKGLGALLGDKDIGSISGGSVVRYLPVEKIKTNPYQPRKRFSEEEIKRLAESISRSGLLQPIVVRPIKGSEGFELIAGERRLRAVRYLEWEQVPAVVKDVDEQEMAVLALVENLQREDISPIEEAKGYKLLIEEFSLTQEGLARIVGKSRSHISNVLRLLTLPPEVQEMLSDGKLSFSQAKELLSGQKEREDLVSSAKKVVEEGKTVRKIREERDIFAKSLSEELQYILGTKVRIEHNQRKGRGKIVLEYFSLEELDRIVELLRKLRRQTDVTGGFSVN